MKIDPIKYYKYADSDDDDYASSEEIKAAYDRLFPDTLDSIIKKISEECVDNLEDDWEEASYSDFDDSDLTDLSTFYHGTVKPYAQRKHIEDFVNSSKPEFIPLESAKDFVKMNTTQQYQCLIQSGIRFCLIQKLPHVYCAKYGIFRFIQADINGSFVVHKELPSELQQIIEPDSLIKLIKTLPSIDNIEHRNPLNSKQDTSLINFKDGIYNIFSGKTLPHSAEYTFLSYINANVGDIFKNDDDNLLDTFLFNSFGNDVENRSNFQEMCGLALSTIRNQKVAFFLYGPSNCGKTAIQSTLRRFIGDEFCSSLTFSQINEKFAIAHLTGKTLNLGGEIPTMTSKTVDRFKGVVGNDTMHVEHKGQIGFDTANYALMTFSCNNLPKINHHDEAFYTRIRIIRYTRSLDKVERINNIDGRIYEESRGAFLRFAIDGLKRFIENGYELSYIKKSDSYVSEYMYNANSFSLFASEYIETAPGEFLLSSEIIAAYKDFCNELSLGKPLNSNVWSGILKSLFDVEDSRTSKARGYQNLRCTYYSEDEKKERGYI